MDVSTRSLSGSFFPAGYLGLLALSKAARFGPCIYQGALSSNLYLPPTSEQLVSVLSSDDGPISQGFGETLSSGP